MKILFYLFYFYFLSTFLLCQYKSTLSDCLHQEKHFYDSVNCECIELNDDNYHDQKKNFNDNFKNNNQDKYKNVNFEQLIGNTNGFKCRQRYSNDIKENCFKAFDVNNENNNEDRCCYMTLDFKYNKKHECYPANKNEVKDIIDELEKEYYGIKSVKIKCEKSQYITFGFFLLFNILFLF
jgi:hypothetical protein